MTRDGALSLDEFSAAMHLVVLRRNNIPIPAVLPTNLAQLLMPEQINKAPVEGDLLHLEDDDNNDESLQQQLTKASVSAPVSTVSAAATSLFPKPPSPVKRPPPIPLKSTDSISSPGEPTSPMMRPKEWTKFTESPTSSMSSPGPKPVNFDIQRTAQAVVSDPQILHPVALRVTPEVVEEEPSRRKTTESGLVYEAGVIIRENSNSSPKIYTTQAQAQQQHRDSISIQRPQPKKVSSKGTIPPPPQREPSSDAPSIPTTIPTATAVNNTSFGGVLSKKDPPPLPPPRGRGGHTRSSSLDLKKLKMGNETTTVAQPQLQPMSSYDGYVEPSQMNDSFADFAHFPEPGAADESTPDYVTTIKVDSSASNNTNATGTTTNVTTTTMASATSAPITTNVVIGNHAMSVSSTAPNNVVTTTNVVVPPIPQPHPRSSGGLSTIGTRTSAFEVYRRQPPSSAGVTQHSQSPNDCPLPLPTSSVANTAIDYEKRVIAITDNLRLVRIRPGETMSDVLKHLKEQNHLLLKLCNDLSEELLEVQAKKENMRLRLDATAITNNNHTNH